MQREQGMLVVTDIERHRLKDYIGGTITVSESRDGRELMYRGQIKSFEQRGHGYFLVTYTRVAWRDASNRLDDWDECGPSTQQVLLCGLGVAVAIDSAIRFDRQENCVSATIRKPDRRRGVGNASTP